MTGLGHNQPPAHEAMALHVDDLFQLVSDTTNGAEVTTDEQEAALDALLDDVRKARKDAEAKRKAEKEPHLEAGRAVDAAWKPVTTKCDAAAKEIKAKLTPYRVEKQRIKDEAARKAREEAERKEREAQEALQNAEAPLDERFDAERKLEEAKKATAVANKIDRAPTGLRTRKVVEVTDRRAALQWIMKRDPDALGAFVDEYARTHAINFPMDGVTVREERKAA
jgi:hypothetical protein